MKIILLDDFKSRPKTENHPKAGWSGWKTLNADPSEQYAALKYTFKAHWIDGVHENDFNFFANFDDEPGLFLDVGANVGTSVISFRNVNKCARILSFEIIPSLSTTLAMLKCDVANFEFRMVGLSDKATTVPLYVPVLGDRLCTYLASTDLSNFKLGFRQKYWMDVTGESSFELLELHARTERCDDLDLGPTLVKIDTEGTELAAVRGMERTLNASKPIVMCENDGTPALVDWFSERDFRSFGYSWEENKLFSIDAGHQIQNFFFIHDGRIAELQSKKPLLFA